jgi:hypothetical protein
VDEQLPPSTEEPAAPAPEAQPQRRTEDRPSRWLALAFVGFVSALVLLSTTGVGAAAATFLGGQEFACGGP